MYSPRARAFQTTGAIVAALCALAGPARADDVGFQLNRYEPTPAGETFFVADRPWYSSTRWFAAGLTLDWAHNPLVLGRTDANGKFTTVQSVIENALLGHVDLAGSFLDRVTVSASLPVTFHEWGQAGGGAAPASGAAVGDLRFGLMLRLWNHADKDVASFHVGANLWVPIGSASDHAGDQSARIMPKLVLGGIAIDHLRWSAMIGYLYRGAAHLGDPNSVVAAGSTVGSELQLTAALGWTPKDRSWNVGPEIAVGSVLDRSGSFFAKAYTSVEIYAGAQYTFIKAIQLGLAVGTGLAREPGTPDFRGLLRLAYAPVRSPDTDGDGIVDDKDACPNERGERSGDPTTSGCPDTDRDLVIDRDDQCPKIAAGANPDPVRKGCPLEDADGDGIVDAKDRCPTIPQGSVPDPNKIGCPLDTDQDGVFDEKDQCVNVPAGQRPDPNKAGCPLDTDKDGVFDDKDQCVTVPQGDKPDTARLGCPADTDHDTVIDTEDQCPDVPMGLSPDPARKGCPAPDRDHDQIPDADDACPDKAGAPDPDTKRNGCPGKVVVTACGIEIKEPVFFETNRDVILPVSFPVLQAVAHALHLPQIKRVSIEGHTDSQGALVRNMDLSDRRAKSVLEWLVAKGGIDRSHLESHGFGPTRPIADNGTAAGRGKNRRVEFKILEPACTEGGK